MNLVKSGKVSTDGEEGVLTLIGTLGGPKELTLLLNRATAEKTPEKLSLGLLLSLERAAKERGVKPDGDLNRINVLAAVNSDVIRGACIRLGAIWKMEFQRNMLLKAPKLFAKDPKASTASSVIFHSILDGLISFGGKESAEAIDELVTSKNCSSSQRRMALVALAAIDLDAAAKRVTDVLSLPSSGDEPVEVFDAFLQRKTGAKLLADALKDKTIPADTAKVGIRTGARPDVNRRS